ncbi:LOW QUALITY PROTEIN: integral membrane protein GPR137B-like [Phacochoerus africanus]|uniref:LOW QUALITY PROTEIN: integral membrane protein GPR137B-like n=1 Tax=Phacochoerus africanus TaxID=41426 RepID=UPI001FD8B425|nr:LOW QUALITY PROTEIN: integral membrane protein GPR137B-like [Phacochoerus africanus]
MGAGWGAGAGQRRRAGLQGRGGGPLRHAGRKPPLPRAPLLLFPLPGFRPLFPALTSCLVISKASVPRVQVPPPEARAGARVPRAGALGGAAECPGVPSARVVLRPMTLSRLAPYSLAYAKESTGGSEKMVELCVNLLVHHGLTADSGREEAVPHQRYSVPPGKVILVLATGKCEVVLRALEESGRLPLYLASLFISLIFLLVNLTCAVLVKTGSWERKVIVSVRVAINDTLFVLCAVSLSICLYKISKMSLANIYLESKGSSVCQVTAVGVTVILLYTSRACYNLFILSFSQSKNVHSFDYDWYNVSDQADLKNQLGDAGYVVFGVVLFVWELLPTTLVVYFFRVRNPTKDLVSKPLCLQKISPHSHHRACSWNILRFSVESLFHPLLI